MLDEARMSPRNACHEREIRVEEQRNNLIYKLVTKLSTNYDKGTMTVQG